MPKHLVAAGPRLRNPSPIIGKDNPSILPKQFSGLTVEQGGFGAGTIIRFQMNVFGIVRQFRAAIAEPEPGRVLVETYLDAEGAVTTFTVNPGPSPVHSEVTISTEPKVQEGVLGAIERFLTTRYLSGIYNRELALLARLTTSRGSLS